jgi:pyruvate,water dikinase
VLLDQHPYLRGRANAEARRRAAEREVRSLPRWSRPAIGWLAERSRRAAALREAGKSTLVSMLQLTRKMASELGRRMVLSGALDRADDIFHLSTWDIAAWAAGEWDGRRARALVADRAARHRTWLALEPPDVIVLDAEGRPAELPPVMASAVSARPAVGGPAERHLTGDRDGRVLVGSGVSAGSARGTARVIRHPDEGARLNPGDVLVAPSTDPGWTPLFLRASAVVMEVGGYLSHGAIVAREYGLPAVANVPGALTLIQDGQTLEVDGDAGTVVVAS